MPESLNRLAAEALATGTLAHLPEHLFVDGAFRKATSGDRMDNFDPGTGKVFSKFDLANADDVDHAVLSSHRALMGAWRNTKPADRSAILYRAGQLMRRDIARLSVAETLDSGKTLQEAQWDVLASARMFEYYAGIADKLQGTTIPLSLDYVSMTMNEPVGVTAHIIPWNYPTSTMVRGIAPALAAGCTAVCKPAETTPLTALMIAELLIEAGLPAGVCNVITGLGPVAGQALVTHPLVRHITFTGSVRTGIQTMQNAAHNVASVTLELGGKSPMVVLEDADIDAAVEGARWAIYSNAGQVCSAGSRLIVERKIHAELVEKFAKASRSLKIGHGLRNPDVGAINSTLQLGRIEAHVKDAKARGLTVAAGGAVISDPETGKGWFFEPTIIDNVGIEDRLVQEEIFGPVMVVQVVDSPEEALAAANATQFALAAGIYTKDITKAFRFARDIDAGQVYVNEYYAGGIEVPFGGNKFSGFGREKGVEGVKAYLRTKAVTVRI
eukprot:gene6508-6577_t